MKQLKFLRTWLLLLCLALSTGVTWGESKTIVFDPATAVTEDVASYANGPDAFTAGGGEWIATGYGAEEGKYIKLGKGTGNYLQTPVLSGNITSITVTWYQSTSYYLAVGTVDGTELEAHQSTASAADTPQTYTYNINGNYKQLRLVARRSSGTSNALATISRIEVTYDEDSSTEPDPTPTTYTVTVANDIANGTVSASPTTAEENAEITLTATPNNGYEFGSWNVTNASTSAAVTVTDNKFTMPAANVIVSATFNKIEQSGGGEEPSGDNATATFIFNTDEGLSALGIKKPNTGSGTNLGTSNYTSGDITLTATDGGTATRVWNSGGTTSLRVYKDGGTLTFSGATITKIVFVGTVPMTANVGSFSDKTWTGEATSVTFTATNSVTISTINVTYEVGDIPTSDPQITNFIKTSTLNLETGAGNYDIRNCLNIPSDYEGTITTTINGTTDKAGEYSCVYPYLAFQKSGTYTVTVTAAAVEGKYAETTGSITVTVTDPIVPLTTMDAIYAKAQEVNGTETDVYVTLNNWIVSGVNGSNAYVTDGTKGFIIYKSGHNFIAGDILSGTVAAKIKYYNGSAEFTTITSATEGLTVTKGGSVTEQNIAISDLTGINTGALVAYENLICHLNGTNVELSDGENVIVAYKGIMNELPEFVDGKTYDVKGVFLMYGTKKEILPRTADDIVLKEILTNYYISYAETENGTIVVKNGDTSLAEGAEVAEGAELTIECTPANADYRFKNWQYKVGDAAWATRTKDFTYTMPSANVQFRANFELIPVYTIAWSVNGEVVKTDNLKEGADVIPPANPEDINGKTFTGWVTTSTVDSDATPEYVTPSATATENVTYYAVFAKQNGDGNDRWEASTLAALTESDIFVIANGVNAMSTAGGTSSSPKAVTLTVENDVITSNVADDIKWNISGNAMDGYYFYKNETEDYLYVNTTASSSSNTCIRVGTSPNVPPRGNWTLDENGFLMTNDTYKTRYLSYYSTASDFRGYVNTTNGAFVPTFYKFVAGTTYSDYCTIVPEPLPTVGTINFVAQSDKFPNKYYATFSNERAIKFEETFVNDDETCLAEIKAYAVTVHDGKIYRTDQCKVNNDGNYTYIPANTGVLFEYTLDEDYAFDGTVPFEYADAEGDYLNTVEDNMLIPCTVDDYFNDGTDDGNYYYKLAYGDNNNKTKLGFWWGAEGGTGHFKVKKGLAILCVPQENAPSKGFSFNAMEDTNAIEMIESVSSDDVIYNLQGIRLNSLQKGINIVNGRKVIR